MLGVISAPAGFFQIGQVNNATIVDLTTEINVALQAATDSQAAVENAEAQAQAAVDSANAAASSAATSAASAAAQQPPSRPPVRVRLRGHAHQQRLGLPAGTPWNNGGVFCIA